MQNYLGSSRVPEERLNAGKSYKILKISNRQCSEAEVR